MSPKGRPENLAVQNPAQAPKWHIRAKNSFAVPGANFANLRCLDGEVPLVAHTAPDASHGLNQSETHF